MSAFKRLTAFEYTNCLNRRYDNTIADIKSVSFFIARYGEHVHKLEFDKVITEKKAIKAVQH
jgi:hypothetical protein